jgi:multimeric flavodoxin WrbA
MRVVGFVGSPRRQGNTAILVNEVLRGVRESGAETRVFYLNEMNIKGCQGCRSCKKPGAVCVQKDDMAAMYNEIKEADAVVIGTPVYFCQMSGQTKIFVDRLYAFLNADFTHKLGEKKKTVMIYSQGQPKPDMFQQSFDLNKGILSLVGLKIKETILAAGNRKIDDVLGNQDIMEKAYNAGKSLNMKNDEKRPG